VGGNRGIRWREPSPGVRETNLQKAKKGNAEKRPEEQARSVDRKTGKEGSKFIRVKKKSKSRAEKKKESTKWQKPKGTEGKQTKRGPSVSEPKKMETTKIRRDQRKKDLTSTKTENRRLGGNQGIEQLGEEVSGTEQSGKKNSQRINRESKIREHTNAKAGTRLE